MNESVESRLGLTTHELLEHLDFLSVEFDHTLTLSVLEELLVSNLVGETATIPCFSLAEVRDVRSVKRSYGIDQSLQYLTQKLKGKLSLNPHPLDYLRSSIKTSFQDFSGIETTDEMVSEIIRRSPSYIKSGYNEEKEEYHWLDLFADYKEELESAD